MHYSDLISPELRIWSLTGLSSVEYAMVIQHRGGKRDNDFRLFMDFVDPKDLCKYANESDRVALAVWVFKQLDDKSRYNWMGYITPRLAASLIYQGFISAKLMEGLSMHKDQTLFKRLEPIWVAKNGPLMQTLSHKDKKHKKRKKSKKSKDAKKPANIIIQSIPRPVPKPQPHVAKPQPKVETIANEADAENEPLVSKAPPKTRDPEPPKFAKAKKKDSSCVMM